MFGSSKTGGEKVLVVFSELSNLKDEKCSEDVSQGSLYTLLNFANMQHFEDKVSGDLGKKFWLILVDYFSAGIQEPTRGKIVLEVVNKIISSQDKGLVSIVASGNEPLSKEKGIEKVIKVLKKISPQEAFRRLKAVKKEVEDTLNECQGDVLTNEDDSKQILQYLQDLEKCSKNFTEPIIEGFLLDHISSLGKLTDELLTKMKDAVLILRDDELRYFYNREVEGEHLHPMASYAQCKKQYDTANRKIMQSHVIVAEQKQSEVNVEKAVEVQTITNESSKEGGKIILCNYPIGLGNKKFFEEEMVGPFRKQIWQEVVSCLIAGVKEPTRFRTVANIVNQIIEIEKKSSFPTFLSNRKKFSKEEFKKATKKLKGLNPQKAFEELKIIELQARSILDKNSESGLPNQDAFEQTLQYLVDLERWLKVVKKPVIDKFLSNSGSFLSKFNCELRPNVSEVMSIVWDDELKCFLEVEEKLNLNNLSVSVIASAGNKLANVESDVNGEQATCSQPVQEDSGVNSKGCSEDDEGFYDAKQYKGKGHDLSGKVTLIKKEESQQLGNQLVDLAEEKNPLEEKLNSIQQDLNAKTKEFEYTKARLEEELDKATEEFERKEADLKNCKKELDNVNAKVSKLELEKSNQKASINGLNKERNQLASKINTLTEEIDRIKTQLEKSKVELKQAKQDASTLEDKVAQLAEENTELKSELSDKNEKFLVAGTSSRRQGNYASVSFTLSGAFAVCASLAVFHLAICISLAVAALTFLAVGCYCSYKANTALSNVEVKNGVDPAVVEVIK